MIQFSVNEVTTYRWSFEEDVAGCQRNGFEGIGLWRPKVAEYGIEKARELLAESQLAATSLSWAGGFTGSDGRTLRDSMFDALDAIEDTVALRAQRLVLVAGGRNNHARNHVQKLLVTSLQELAEAAEAVNIRLALEPMHVGCAHDWTFVTDIRKTLDVIGEVGSPYLGINLDTYHLGLDGEIFSWLPSIAKYIQLVQMGDGTHAPLGEQNRCSLGHGRVPNSAIIQTLVEAGYRGPFELELCGEEFEHVDYDRLLRESREYLDQVMVCQP
jgi:sugar phosphate isomerase/epimerase